MPWPIIWGRKLPDATMFSNLYSNQINGVFKRINDLNLVNEKLVGQKETEVYHVTVLSGPILLEVNVSGGGMREG